MSKIADNNIEIINKILKRRQEKSNVKDNIFNVVYGRGVFDGNSLFPTINTTNEITNAGDNIFESELGLPITIFNDGINNLDGDSNFLHYQNNLNEDVLLQKQDIITQNISKHRPIMESTTDSDMLELQHSLTYILQEQDEYKKYLSKVAGTDFEHLVAFTSQGKNLDNLLKHKYVKDASKNAENEVTDKVMRSFLYKKRVNKRERKLLKNIYSVNNSSASLYDIYMLENKTEELYVEKISVINKSAFTDTGLEVMPKADIEVLFFKLNNQYSNLEESYRKRIIFNSEPLNISVKMAEFRGYHTVDVRAYGMKLKTEDEVKKNLHTKLIGAGASQNMATAIENDCFRSLSKFLSDNKIKKDSNIDIMDFLFNLQIAVSHNSHSDMESYQKKGAIHYATFYPGSKTLGQFDSDVDKKNAIKFLGGNFNIHTKGNANAKLHVKNKSSIGNINMLLNSIEPISFHNKMMIKLLNEININYAFIFKSVGMFNISGKRNTLEIKDINKFFISTKKERYDDKTPLEIYLFNDKKDIDDLKQYIYMEILKGLKPEVKKIIQKNIDTYLNNSIFNNKYLRLSCNKFIPTIIEKINKDVSGEVKESGKKVNIRSKKVTIAVK